MNTGRHVVVFKSRSKSLLSRWRYRVVAGNGEIISQSQSYVSKWNAKRGAKTNTGLPVYVEGEA